MGLDLLRRLVHATADSENKHYRYNVRELAAYVNGLKKDAREWCCFGELGVAAGVYSTVLEIDPCDSLKFVDEDVSKVVLGWHRPKFRNRFEDFEYHKNLIERLAGNLGVPIEKEWFNPVSAYVDFARLFGRSVKRKEWSAVGMYGFCMLTGLIPPYGDFADLDNKMEKISLKTQGVAVSPLVPLLAFAPGEYIVAATGIFAAYQLMLHGFYNGTKVGMFRMMGHEYTHIHQMLTVQRMFNDGLCDDVDDFLDQAYNELEALSFGKFAVSDDIKDYTPDLVERVIRFSEGSSC